ncbi:DUF2637 domain-containing protein [Solwaraspora sp. WMMD1047]|uniref:DUF2637 domain-containing protein n=1 Tax=Solwaraspora sp. WMMD1047 TaxID=3016102 RepID=UPI00241599C1|nr:DUF2637 domain-containing protein [Solwaraspora sp. WMMD1047]MDG4833940.1 DUF2637 domain-containing protein [Solwaraspora sp. WMMD1047]
MTAVFVAGLAVVAGAISFAHMTELANTYGQTGWKAYAFPISVDGLEIVASLYLVVQRRAGRPTGWTPWVALVIGTAASLAANIAVGGHDPIGKALAGWPALSMLVAVKLLFGMIDHSQDDQPAVPDDQRPSADRPAVPGTVPQTGPDSRPSSGPAPDGRTGIPGPSETGGTGRAIGLTSGRSGGRASTPLSVGQRTVAHLLPAARTASAALAATGRSLSRDRLADAMRNDGHGVSNERASLLLKILQAEQDVATISAGFAPPRPEDLTLLSEEVA